MVTQRSSLSAPSPSNHPVRPRQPSESPLALEPRENSAQENAASSPRQQAIHAAESAANENSLINMSSSDHQSCQRRSQPTEVWEPRASVSTTDTSGHGHEDNVWDESSHPPGYYELSKPAAARSSETNPFLRKPLPPTNSHGTSPHPPSTLQQQQQQQEQSQLNDSFSRLVFDEPSSSHNPWQAAMDSGPSRAANSHPHSVAPSDMGTDPWARSTPDASTKEPQAPTSPALLSFQSDGSGWEDASDDDDDDDDDDHGNEKSGRDASGDNGSIVHSPAMNEDLARDQHVWDDGPSMAPMTRTGPVSGSGTTPGTGSGSGSTPLDDWNMVESDIYSPSPKNPSPKNPSPKNPSPSRESQSKSKEAGEAFQAPTLPPRSTGDQARWTSSRLPPDGPSGTYQVKNIRWHDPASRSNPRSSPILMQNQNGPCPLVALVNALTLTTPADISGTSLVSILRSREQVSLKLLLDAVFDELMTSRRTKSDKALPDVSDLYAFLQSLHTGMNVNPRFIPSPEMVEAFKHTSLTHIHPDERGKFIPGTFENTLEMSLYAAFSIPLIHGWLPPMDDPAYGAMYRHAESYEDTQNLLFREEEFERKFSMDSGLTEGEQALYNDIVRIRMFLDSSATQLTPWGIDVIGKVMRPGTFAILFRNDHFSTLYCHPETQQLFTLVTDAGYESHKDIVWESLLDVNGVMNEYLSGDFRPLGGVAATTSDNVEHAPSQREAAMCRRGKSQDLHTGMPISPEQEDRDLALALQLQEEEDQKHRRREERRKREAILSERYIEQASRRPVAPSDHRTGNHAVPPRRSSNSISVAPPVTTTTTTATNVPSSRRRDPAPRQPAPTSFDQMQRFQGRAQQLVRPLVPPPRRPGVNRPPQEDDEPPPPSYEQAAQVPAYHPPPGHPTHPGSTASASSRRATALEASPHATVGAPGAGFSDGGQRLSNMSGRRAPNAPTAGMATYRDRDCIIM